MTSSTKLQHQQIKTLLSSLNEKDFRKVFDKFLEITREKVQRTVREISYKCFEAHTSVKNKQAAGYGRNQQQAITNSLRNLVETLLEDDKIILTIKECVKKINDTNQEDKENKKKVYLDVSKFSHKSGINLSLNEDNFRSKSKLKGDNNDSSNEYLLQSTNADKNTTSLGRVTMGNGYEQQLRITQLEDELKKAREYINNLETKLNIVMQENKFLKESPLANESQKSVFKESDFDKEKSRSISIEPQAKPPNNNISMIIDDKKNKVPRLKLEVLPNYHGKSNKSLNQSLLAAYQEKNKGGSTVGKVL